MFVYRYLSLRGDSYLLFSETKLVPKFDLVYVPSNTKILLYDEQSGFSFEDIPVGVLRQTSRSYSLYNKNLTLINQE